MNLRPTPAWRAMPAMLKVPPRLKAASAAATTRARVTAAHTIAGLDHDIVGQAGQRASRAGEAHPAGLPEELGDLSLGGSSAVPGQPPRRLHVRQVVAERQHVRAREHGRAGAAWLPPWASTHSRAGPSARSSPK